MKNNNLLLRASLSLVLMGGLVAAPAMASTQKTTSQKTEETAKPKFEETDIEHKDQSTNLLPTLLVAGVVIGAGCYFFWPAAVAGGAQITRQMVENYANQPAHIQTAISSAMQTLNRVKISQCGVATLNKIAALATKLTGK